MIVVNRTPTIAASTRCARRCGESGRSGACARWLRGWSASLSGDAQGAGAAASRPRGHGWIRNLHLGPHRNPASSGNPKPAAWSRPRAAF